MAVVERGRGDGGGRDEESLGGLIDASRRCGALHEDACSFGTDYRARTQAASQLKVCRGGAEYYWTAFPKSKSTKYLRLRDDMSVS